nr:helix-turn-helix domain-containing protein [Rubrivivax sp.]
TQSEIAARVGTVREVVARAFADFVDRGLIERVGSALFVADWDGLCDVAGVDPQDAERSSQTTDEPVIRTARFFLSSQEGRKHRTSNDPSVCRDHLDNVDLCRRRGCPAGEFID